ncbi:oxidoreductase [Sphingomonas zeae]|jgi:NAD(P)-dependent dehydrogenase (short-subunit alcohol dehydrogenase family)
MKTWFITGISRGLGLELAKAALARGDTVIGTTRGARPALAEESGTLHVLALDMADAAGIAASVEEAFAIGGAIDVIVNNAGYGLLGAIETATDEEATRLFDVDVFGPFRVIRAALPYLRAQGSGHIVNITSIAGRAPGPACALYSAAKYALEGLSAALVHEVSTLGVRVTAVAPGAFRTDFLSAHSIRKSRLEDAAYSATIGQASAAFDAADGQQLGDPARAAQVLLKMVDSSHPPLHLLLGSDALRRARAKLDEVMVEMDKWESMTISTDFPTSAS